MRLRFRFEVVERQIPKSYRTPHQSCYQIGYGNIGHIQDIFHIPPIWSVARCSERMSNQQARLEQERVVKPSFLNYALEYEDWGDW